MTDGCNRSSRPVLLQGSGHQNCQRHVTCPNVVYGTEWSQVCHVRSGLSCTVVFNVMTDQARETIARCVCIMSTMLNCGTEYVGVTETLTLFAPILFHSGQTCSRAFDYLRTRELGLRPVVVVQQNIGQVTLKSICFHLIHIKFKALFLKHWLRHTPRFCGNRMA